jgi:hypothetical protein
MKAGKVGVNLGSKAMQRACLLMSGSLLLAASVSCGEKSDDSFATGGRGATTTGGTAGAGAGSAGAPATGGNAGSSVGGSAGAGAAAGSATTGGSAGLGGMDGIGGAGGSVAGGGATTGGTGGGTPVPCTITPTAAVSTAIATVGVVTFTTDLAGLTGASIEFGLTTAYGMTAPVNLAEPSYRTLLLGMKQSRPYHFRVVARAGQSECASADTTLMTGSLGNNLPTVMRTTNNAAGLAGGFLVGTISQQPGTTFILDADGDIVWWFATGSASRAHMSYDSRHLWFLTTNQGGGNPNVRRVGMDGMGVEMHPEFGDAHHDLVVLPDESVGFPQYMGGRDRLMERAPDGTVRMIVDVPMAHGGVTNNHTNSVQYYAPDDSYTFSDLDQNCYVKVSRQGQVAWVLGGNTSDFTGAGATWTREHGHHLLAPNRILFFNNGNNGADSIMREVTLDLSAMTAATTWMYNGSENSNTLGDVQRLWNGNSLATYSNAGIFHEVNASGTLLESLEFSTGGGVGYAMKRQTLYGPPPKHATP